jgi:eukaryotic-like serine/threonine-protein kinase
MIEELPRPIKGGYLLLEVIGKGGMGVVYKGVHTVLEREVAIKVLHPNLTCDPIVEKRFLREARSIGRIKNKHVVEVLNFGKTEDEALYIVMEYIDGTILSQALREEKYLEPSRAIHIITQICEALSAAHAQGVIHRDLKPANVMLLQNREHPDFVKLLDFGVAKILDETENTLTRDGLIVGTFSTMAPEQLLGYDVDGRSDLYSLGIVLYTLITGKAPFKGRDLATLCYQHVHVKPMSPLAANPDADITPALNMAIMRALCKNPEYRFQKMEDFAQALQQSLHAPHDILEETLQALHKDAASLPPTTVGEQARLQLLDSDTLMPGFEELTTTDGRQSLPGTQQTISQRYPRPQKPQKHNDTVTLWTFAMVVMGCVFLLAWGIFLVSPQTTAGQASTGETKTIPPTPLKAPAIHTPPAPTAGPPSTPQTPPPLQNEALPKENKAKKAVKKVQRKRKNRTGNRKPDLIRVHTQPKVKSKRSNSEIK